MGALCKIFSSNSNADTVIMENSFYSHNTSHNVNTHQALNKCLLCFISRKSFYSLHLQYWEERPNPCQKIGKNPTHFQKGNETKFPRNTIYRIINSIGHVELSVVSSTLFKSIKSQYTPCLHQLIVQSCDLNWPFKNSALPVSPSYLKIIAIKHQGYIYRRLTWIFCSPLANIFCTLLCSSNYTKLVL